MSIEKLHQLLQSRSFKVCNPDNTDLGLIYRFTEKEIIEDNKVVSHYELKLTTSGFEMVFKNANIYTGDFKNILLVADDYIIGLNYDLQEAPNRQVYKVSLEGQ